MVLAAANISPVVALVAGILILVVPQLLNYVVAIYLIVVGLVGVNSTISLLETSFVPNMSRIVAVRGGSVERKIGCVRQTVGSAIGAREMTPNSRFIGVVGTIIVILIGIALYQKASRCSEEGGKACCFGRLCNPIAPS